MIYNKTVGVVIPAYNEEQLLGGTIKGIPSFVDRICVIDDCSTDKTFQIMESLAQSDKRIICKKHDQNMGAGAAVITGYKQVINDGIDITVTMDGDNQMDPKNIVKIIQPIIDQKADYVKGDRLSNRDNHKSMSHWRRFGNKILVRLTRISTGNGLINDPQNGYTAISLDALQTIDVTTVYPGYGYLNDILVRLAVNNYEVANVPMLARYDSEKSTIRYSEYIPRVAWLLLKNLMWRLKAQYLKQEPVTLPEESGESSN